MRIATFLIKKLYGAAKKEVEKQVRSRSHTSVGSDVKLSSSRFDPHASSYRLTTLDEIKSIPEPSARYEALPEVTDSIEYVLLRKATEFKRMDHMDEAIACLQKFNAIAPFSPMGYALKDYERLPKYLRKVGRAEEAECEESRINCTLKTRSSENFLAAIDRARMSGFVEVAPYKNACPQCAKYCSRIYAVKDGRYPDINIFIHYYTSKKCNCSLTFYTFFPGVTRSVLGSDSAAQRISNRPF